MLPEEVSRNREQFEAAKTSLGNVLDSLASYINLGARIIRISLDSAQAAIQFTSACDRLYKVLIEEKIKLEKKL